jgi:SAM-dependent methyltransferase
MTTFHGYAVPPVAEPSLQECRFYQTIDIPGFGVQNGTWDLRPNIAKYLGSIDLVGARVLEIGTANGFVCFEMERRGAHVVAFDLSDDMTYDAPPVSDEYLARDVYLDGLRRIRNAYWLTHRRLGSKAQVAYGHANQLPVELGEFDVGVIANVLQHLQDPVGALMQLAKRSKAVVVTETDWLKGYYDDLNGMIYFEKDNPFVWYQVKPRLVESVLRKMGFTRFERTNHTQLLVESVEHKPGEGAVGVKMGVDVPHFTIVAYR